MFDLAQKHGAVIVSPNYRLMPEATSREIFEDMEDFWAWLHSTTTADFLAQQHNVQLDLSRVLVAGESAGGLLSVSLALSRPHEIRSCTAGYPCVDMTSDHFTKPSDAPLLDASFPSSLVADYAAQVAGQSMISSAYPPARLDLMLAAVQRGQITELYERDINGWNRTARYPFEKLDQTDTVLPVGGIAILHGLQDDVVPIEGCERFVAEARNAMTGRPGADKIVLTGREGGHGFDGEVGLEEPWLLDHLKFALEAWLH